MVMKIIVMIIMVIKMVEINSDHGCDHVAFTSKSLPVTSRTETRSIGTGSREQPEAGALYSTWQRAEVISSSRKILNSRTCSGGIETGKPRWLSFNITLRKECKPFNLDFVNTNLGLTIC